MKNAARPRMERGQARSVIYRHLSALFVYPESTAWGALHEISVKDMKRLHSLLGWSAKEFLHLQNRLLKTSQEGFETEHVALFGHTVAGELPPYEASYDSSHVFQESHCLADIAGFYRAFGLESSEARRERPDHIAVELEFMHVLALKEAYALVQGWTEQADLCRDAEHAFLRDHLGRWAPSFLKGLCGRSPGGIFELVARSTAVCLVSHCRDAGIRAGASDLEPAPSASEPEGTNFSCVAPCPVGTAADPIATATFSKEESE